MERGSEAPAREHESAAAYTTGQYAQSIGLYLQHAGSEGILRPQQTEVFGDIQNFFAQGYNKGYVSLPTGIGKTVLFVELSKALREQSFLEGQPQARPPRILVASPTRDLVHQTMGRTSQKGYGRFAPGLTVGSYFSDSTMHERANLPSKDIVITTYRSLKIMEEASTDTYERRGLLDDETLQKLARRQRFRQGSNLLELFDVIILDEAHHATGDAVSTIIDRMADDQTVIGFSATPDVRQDRRLVSVLPYKIHELSMPEAINMQLLAPIVPMGIESGIHVLSTELYDSHGDFLDDQLEYLAAIKSRNNLAVEAGKVFKQAGIGMIFSCIAGNKAWHPHHMAELLNKEGIKAAGVDGTLSSKARQKIYDQFESGELDALAFIGLLGEGWDSNRAKALINVRPTRSTVFATQRIGRVTRPGATAYVVDICDTHNVKAPPILSADVLHSHQVELGQSMGRPSDSQKVQQIITGLTEKLPVMQNLKASYLLLEEEAKNLDQLKNGILFSEAGVALFALLGAVSRAHIGLTPEMVARYEHITGTLISTKDAIQDGALRVVYDQAEVKTMLGKIPFIESQRWYESPDGDKWAPLPSLCYLFEARYPDANRDVLRKMLRSLERPLDWVPCKTPRPFSQRKKFNLEKAYRIDDSTVRELDGLISDYFTTR